MIKSVLKPTNKTQALYIFCDGGARGNPGPAAYAFVVEDNKGKTLVEESRYLGQATNNIAEYQAIINALKWLINRQKIISFGSYTLNLYSDSQLVINQLNGRFKIKNPRLQELIIQVKRLSEQLKANIIYHHVPRTKNQRPDALLNQTLNLLFKKKPLSC